MPSAPFRYQNLSQHEKLQKVPPCTSVRLTSDLVPQLVPTRPQKNSPCFFFLFPLKMLSSIQLCTAQIEIIWAYFFCKQLSQCNWSQILRIWFIHIHIRVHFSDSNIQNGDLSRMYLLLFSDFLCLLKSNFPTRQRIPTKTAQLWDIQR